jgi:hypothetical protein
MQDEGADLGIPGIADPIEVGRGGFAVVYRARQPAFPRDVAVKVLDVRPDAQDMSRFSREVRAMVALGEHPAIVPLFDAGTTASGRPFLLMPYLSGGSLQDALDRGERIGWPEARDIGVRLAGALQAAHDEGILHRDIKPANVLKGRFGDAMLADFGIARVVGAHVTTSGVVTASLAYAAPEILEGLPPSTASDVYGLAATLYGLMAGRGPFESQDVAEESILPLLTRTLTAALPALPDVPDAAMAVLHRAMDRDPTARHPSAAAFAEALRSTERPAAAAPDHHPPPSTPPAPGGPDRASRRTRALAVGAVTTAVIGIVAVGSATSRDAGPLPEPSDAGPGDPFIAIYEATDGPSWVRSDGWSTGEDPCTFHGISCTDGRVTAISLPDNGLSGALPPDLGSLTDLRTLDVRGNRLTSLPPEIGDLVDLRFLDVGSNELRSLPPEIGDLTELETLWAFDNDLSSLPAEIGGLADLHTINVDRNQLSSLPPEIGDLANLRNLDARINRLSSLPAEIGELGRLQRLVVRINQLTSLPAEVGTLPDLRHLAVDDNALGGDITPWAMPLAQADTIEELLLSDAAGTGNGCMTVTDAPTKAWLDAADPEWQRDCQ